MSTFREIPDVSQDLSNFALSYMKMMIRYRLFQILSKQTLAIIILLSIHAVMQAQTPDFAGDTAVVQKCWPLRMLDTVLDFRDNIVKNDTSYIARLPQKLKLGFAVNCSGADINARGSGERGDIQSRLSTNIKTTVSANIAYRGLGIGIKIDPTNVFTWHSTETV